MANLNTTVVNAIGTCPKKTMIMREFSFLYFLFSKELQSELRRKWSNVPFFYMYFLKAAECRDALNILLSFCHEIGFNARGQQNISSTATQPTAEVGRSSRMSE